MPKTITGPDELLASVPHLLGFQPTDSVVLVWIADDQLVLTQRFDLAAISQARAEPEVLCAPALRVGADHVVLVAFTQDLRTLEPDLAELPAILECAGATVVDAIVTDGDRWWSLTCQDQCCPPQGRTIDTESRIRIAAHFVLDGVVVSPDRESLRAEIAAHAELVEATNAAAVTLPDHPREAWVALCLAQWHRVISQQQRQLPTRVFTTHLVATRDVVVRDVLVWHLGRLTRDELLAVSWLLRSVMRGIGAGHAAPVGTLAAIASWMTGDGARAQVCLDRVLAEDPDYRLGRIIQASVGAGLPPSEYRALLQSIELDALVGKVGYSPA